MLELVTSKGRDKTLPAARLVVLPEHIERFRMNDPHTVRDAARNAFFVLKGGFFADRHTKIFLPLFAKEEFVGAIALGRKLGGAPFRPSDKDVLRVIAHQMAITLHNGRLFLEVSKKAAENKRLYTSLQRIYQDSVQAFAAAIDAKDGYTKDHSYRVATYAVAIARELGWKKKDLEGLYIAGLLHDIGKIGVPQPVLHKNAMLSPADAARMVGLGLSCATNRHEPMEPTGGGMLWRYTQDSNPERVTGTSTEGHAHLTTGGTYPRRTACGNLLSPKPPRVRGCSRGGGRREALCSGYCYRVR